MQLIASPQPAKAKLLASGLIKENAASGLYIIFLFFSLWFLGEMDNFAHPDIGFHRASDVQSNLHIITNGKVSIPS